METRVSTKGQIVLPKPIRKRMGLRPGDPLDAKIESGRIVLTPRRKRSRKARIVVDPVSGLPMLTADPDEPTLTSEEVAMILAEIP